MNKTHKGYAKQARELLERIRALQPRETLEHKTPDPFHFQREARRVLTRDDIGDTIGVSTSEGAVIFYRKRPTGKSRALLEKALTYVDAALYDEIYDFLYGGKQ